jgi:hypothetical protein
MVDPTSQPEAPGLVPGDAGSLPGGDARDIGRESATTQSQLRRFIKSRAWIPMHELRRRFGIEGDDEDMSQILVEGRRLYVGLPPREAAMIGDLIRQGEVGFELLMDPVCPGIAGLYPMRPVIRG